MSAKTPLELHSRAERRSLIASLDGNQRRALRQSIRNLTGFSNGFLGVRLRPYQLKPAQAVIDSVFARDGKTFVLLFARQSGKDEMIASLILFLLARLGEVGGNIVCANPTYIPQTTNAMQRLEARAFQRRFFGQAGLKQVDGFRYSHARASVMYFSASPGASVVGFTADRLLIINEAQDVSRTIYDKRFAPMAAAGNATRLFSGTAWTADTLLDREKRLALREQEMDGIQRVFVVDGQEAARHNPYYARFLKNEVARLGREHPLIRTQYFCENLDARSGMFTAAHRLLMRGDILPKFLDAPKTDGDPAAPVSGEREGSMPCAFLLDVAGQEESSTSAIPNDGAGGSRSLPETEWRGIEAGLNHSRDSVTLRIVEVDLSSLETLHFPTYRVVHTRQWLGENHLTVFGALKALSSTWRPEYIVMDATGVGEGLWALLDRAFPTRVIPVKFTMQVKSELGYGFLAIINSGRFKDCDPSAETDRQYAACEAEVLIGPARTLRWGVPDGRRDEFGRLIHDDIPVTDSLTAILDKQRWILHATALVVPGRDPLLDDDFNIWPQEMGRVWRF